MSRAAGCFRSSTRLRLLRLSATKLTLSSCDRGGMARPMSPFGGSILITSAPMSANSVPASGPAMKLASSMIRRPASGCDMDPILNGAIDAGCSLDLDPGLVDDVLVHRHLARKPGAKSGGRLGRDRQAGLGIFFADVRLGQD